MNPKKYLKNWIRGWLPREPTLPSHQRIRATHAKSQKGVRSVAVISVGVIATALLLAVAFPNPPKPLKQNLYQKTFTDYPYGLASLDVFILYETENDGTWSTYRINTWPAGGLSTAGYNITVLIRLNYVNESVISNLNVLDWQLGADGPIATSSWGWYYPAQAAPIDWGTNLMDFWSNRSAWCAVSTLCYPHLFDSTGRPREFGNINYHFTIREIQTNGTRFLLGVDDIISVPVSRK